LGLSQPRSGRRASPRSTALANPCGNDPGADRRPICSTGRPRRWRGGTGQQLGSRRASDAERLAAHLGGQRQCDGRRGGGLVGSSLAANTCVFPRARWRRSTSWRRFKIATPWAHVGHGHGRAWMGVILYPAPSLTSDSRPLRRRLPPRPVQRIALKRAAAAGDVGKGAAPARRAAGDRRRPRPEDPGGAEGRDRADVFHLRLDRLSVDIDLNMSGPRRRGDGGRSTAGRLRRCCASWRPRATRSGVSRRGMLAASGWHATARRLAAARASKSTSTTWPAGRCFGVKQLSSTPPPRRRWGGTAFRARSCTKWWLEKLSRCSTGGRARDHNSGRGRILRPTLDSSPRSSGGSGVGARPAVGMARASGTTSAGDPRD